MKTLSVACGDSSPRGRAKRLLQTRQYGAFYIPARWITPVQTSITTAPAAATPAPIAGSA